MNYLSLFKILVLAGVALVVMVMVNGAVKNESLCTWESATVSGSTAEVKVWRKDVEKKVTRQWRGQDKGLVSGSMVITCNKKVYTVLDTRKNKDSRPPFPKTGITPRKGECEVVFYSSPSSNTNTVTLVRSAASKEVMSHLHEALKAMLTKPGTHRVTCGKLQYWMVRMKDLARRVPELFIGADSTRKVYRPRRERPSHRYRPVKPTPPRREVKPKQHGRAKYTRPPKVVRPKVVRQRPRRHKPRAVRPIPKEEVTKPKIVEPTKVKPETVEPPKVEKLEPVEKPTETIEPLKKPTETIEPVEPSKTRKVEKPIEKTEPIEKPIERPEPAVTPVKKTKPIKPSKTNKTEKVVKPVPVTKNETVQPSKPKVTVPKKVKLPTPISPTKPKKDKEIKPPKPAKITTVQPPVPTAQISNINTTVTTFPSCQQPLLAAQCRTDQMGKNATCQTAIITPCGQPLCPCPLIPLNASGFQG
ncbi:hypothetical protein Pmani_038050 [Petrolisthes manimaculis]|uniref:Uncharacterized protein n=1 Tax=Petrolisthes manimaculis TaxID=1843537 RepID=A0AAE1NFL6_9EUCA|nr:hypothetical protein Pmani_038050 [Petrolisthes manimaculis]